jgi:hypothetical protein
VWQEKKDLRRRKDLSTDFADYADYKKGFWHQNRKSGTRNQAPGTVNLSREASDF